MSKRKNGTYRAAAAGGWNPYGWGNGKGRKKPREYRRNEKSPAGANCHGSGN
ncbi:hypothetical protein [Hungatella effluvii]|uniref:hypothetical protein n=1 Tax=Hungatella effluvii TaxID=1096246 RepID=UPI001F599AA2|nr:hypothetical protein [Hungatella effluvii]